MDDMSERSIRGYQRWTNSTAMGYATTETEGVETKDAIIYLCLAVNGEAGELAEKAKRIRREDADADALTDEVGDVIWYLARLADELDVGLDEIIRDNVDKLEDRDERNQITGSGDNR